VSILTASSLTIAVGSQLDIRAAVRKVTGASTTAYVGLKLNTTQAQTDVAWKFSWKQQHAWPVPHRHDALRRHRL
jgi:hypothetical protein